MNLRDAYRPHLTGTPAGTEGAGSTLSSRTSWQVLLERERIDLVLMSGDVFESQMPPPEAERAVSGFFKRLGVAGVPSVVVAGNHDHPVRMDAWGLLAEFVGVQARGLPRRRTEGGLIELPTKAGDLVCVAAVPWASPGRIVEALTLARDETLAKQQYADAMQHILAHLAEGFRSDTVNIVVAHSYIAGAKSCGSERIVTMGDEWAATAQSLPAVAQYRPWVMCTGRSASCRWSAHAVCRLSMQLTSRSQRREELCIIDVGGKPLL